jgi:16S rRNA (uracil1498-N3)-methyltransferase
MAVKGSIRYNMGMPRFYLSCAVEGNTAKITDSEQVHHLRDVLRLKLGDSVTAFDNLGNEYQCIIQSLNRDLVELQITRRKVAVSSKLRITIACSIPKKAVMDDIIDKLTQLGVEAIIPLETERSIVKLEEKSEARLERWRKIARNAAEQSQRNTLPEIPQVMSLKSILTLAGDFDVKLVPTLSAKSSPVRDLVAGVSPGKVLVLIGPEGDFTPQEVQDSLRLGFLPVSLGNTVLRVETAAIAIASYLRLELGEYILKVE